MTCLNNLKKIKQRASDAVNQTEAIKECLLCKERNAQIVAHHKDVKNVASAMKQLATCKQCQPILASIIECAKKGHIKIEDDQ